MLFLHSKLLSVQNFRNVGETPNNTLADLYDYLATPPDLLKAHRELDKAVEKAYGQTFKTDEERMEFLFEKYQQTY